MGFFEFVRKVVYIALLIKIIVFIYKRFAVKTTNKINVMTKIEPNINPSEVKEYKKIINKNKKISDYKMNARIYLIIAIILISIILLYSYIFIIKSEKGIIIFGIMVFAVFICLLKYYEENAKCVKFYNEEIISDLLKRYNSSYNYLTNLGVCSADFMDSGLLIHADKYESTNLITGEINNFDFKMSKLITYQKVENDGKISYIETFDGMFAEIELNTNIKDDLIIIPTTLLNKTGQTLIDNEEFEQIFNIYSKNKITALRILTPDFTSEIMDIYNNCGFDFSLSIKGNKLYICFHVPGMFKINSISNSRVAIKCIKNALIIKNIDLYMERLIKGINKSNV